MPCGILSADQGAEGKGARQAGQEAPASKRDREKDTTTTEQHTTLTQHTMIHTHYTTLVVYLPT